MCYRRLGQRGEKGRGYNIIDPYEKPNERSEKRLKIVTPKGRCEMGLVIVWYPSS